MTLLITILLCLINIFNTITSESPYAKSFTSISTWMIACILFVTSTLLQYGAILLFWKYTASHKENFQMILKKIDMVCVTVETLAFILFNLIFWNNWKSFFVKINIIIHAWLRMAERMSFLFYEPLLKFVCLLCLS